jgi:hypothetical protein
MTMTAKQALQISTTATTTRAVVILSEAKDLSSR